jgi:dihydroneopterin aldolase
LVLDAVDGPSTELDDAVELAAWFASTFDVQQIIVIGADLPSATQVPLRVVDVDQAVL